jgi:cytochrome c oxidase subunit 2
MRHFVIVIILVLVMTVLTYFGLTALQLLPVAASAQAATIDWLFDLDVKAISFLFALIVAPMIYSLIVFRRKKGETGEGKHFEGNTPLEITWTVIPLFVVMTFAYLGSYSLGETRRVDTGAMIINVTAQQFAWTFEYPDYGIVSKELYLPVNKQVLLKMQSKDVIHSFWVPEFRIKQDVVPGRVTDYRITPILEGFYRVRCAELCGTSHSYMLANVEVVPLARFDSWVAAEQEKALAAAETPEARGQMLVAQNGCSGCHSIDGSPLVGPTWLGVYGSQHGLTDGSTVTVDDAYIQESILNPSAKIVSGFESASQMPGFEFTEEQLADIIAYMKTLK